MCRSSFEADYYTCFYRYGAAQDSKEMRDASDHSNELSSLSREGYPTEYVYNVGLNI